MADIVSRKKKRKNSGFVKEEVKKNEKENELASRSRAGNGVKITVLFLFIKFRKSQNKWEEENRKESLKAKERTP